VTSDKWLDFLKSHFLTYEVVAITAYASRDCCEDNMKRRKQSPWHTVHVQ
jgi:hypothetical protein